MASRVPVTSEAVRVLLTLGGSAVILVTLRDVLHELFNPEMTGSMSSLLARALWRFTHWSARGRRSVMQRAGPVMIGAIGGAWVLLIASGAALIYLPRLPQDFDIGPGVPEPARHGLVTALYVSSAVMTSVGTGDITPKATGVRMLAAVEPILGLVLITAWITWVLSIYPILANRRAFEREVALLRSAAPEPAIALADTPRDAVSEMLRTLTSQLIVVATELEQSEISYYFQNKAPELSLAAQLPYVLALGRAADAPAQPPLIRHYGSRLRAATEDLLRHTGRHYLEMPGDSPDRVLAGLAADHLLPAAARAA